MTMQLSDAIARLAAATYDHQLVALQVFAEVAPDLPTYEAALEQGLLEAGIIEEGTS